MMFRDVFGFQRNLNRRGFLSVFIVISAISTLIKFLFFSWDLHPISSELAGFLLITLLDFTYLAILTPFVIQRINDLRITKWWILVIWTAGAFDLRTVLLVQNLWGFYIDPLAMPLLLLNVVSLVLVSTLFLCGGRQKSKIQ